MGVVVTAHERSATFANRYWRAVTPFLRPTLRVDDPGRLGAGGA